MTLTFITHDPCGVCGYHRHGVMVVSMRVNKRSMRSVGNSLCFVLQRCRECDRVTPLLTEQRWRLTPDSAAKVRAYRSRRWPELTEEAA